MKNSTNKKILFAYIIVTGKVTAIPLRLTTNVEVEIKKISIYKKLLHIIIYFITFIKKF